MLLLWSLIFILQIANQTIQTSHICTYTTTDQLDTLFGCPTTFDNVKKIIEDNLNLTKIQLDCGRSVQKDWFSLVSTAEHAEMLRFVDCMPVALVVVAGAFNANDVVTSLEITQSNAGAESGNQVWKFENGSLSTLKRTLRTLKLNNLGLSDNTSYEIPDLSVLISTSLIDLDLSFNTISSLDGLVDRDRCNLERLVLDHNELETIDSPKFWSKCSKLTYFSATHNQLELATYHHVLQSSIEILDISYNNISSFNIERMVNLKELYLANNKLNGVPIDIKGPSKSIFKSSPNLSLLDLSHNQIRNVSNFLFELNHEKRKEYPKVKLVGNPLKCDCDSSWMAANSSYEYRTVPTRKDKHRVVIDRYLPIIEDRNKVTCQQLWQLNTGKSVIKPISEVEGQYYLCAHLVHGPKYFANPNKAPNCEWNATFYEKSPSICDERSVCPATRPNSPKCYCFHNGYDGDIVDCRGANLDIDIRKNSQLETMDVYHENVIRHAANAVLSSRTIIARFDGATIHRTANSTIPKMHALPSKDLKIYMFNNSNINAIGSSILKFCDQIEYVTLSHNNLKILPERLFEIRYPKLLELDLSNNDLSEIEAAEKQRSTLPNLKILRLNNNNFTELNPFIEDSSKYSAMEELYIGENPWNLEDRFLEWVLKNKNIISDIQYVYICVSYPQIERYNLESIIGSNCTMTTVKIDLDVLVNHMKRGAKTLKLFIVGGVICQILIITGALVLIKWCPKCKSGNFV